MISKWERNGRHLQIETVLLRLFLFSLQLLFALLNLSSFYHLYLPLCVPPPSQHHLLAVVPPWFTSCLFLPPSHHFPSLPWRFHSLSVLSHSISYLHFSLSPCWTPSFIPWAPSPPTLQKSNRDSSLPPVTTCPGHKRTDGRSAGGGLLDSNRLVLCSRNGWASQGSAGAQQHAWHTHLSCVGLHMYCSGTHPNTLLTLSAHWLRRNRWHKVADTITKFFFLPSN